VSVHHFLKAGDRISQRDASSKMSQQTEVSDMPPLNIVAYTPDYLIINKQEGIAVHPGAGVRGVTISEMVCAVYPDIRGVGEQNRPGIVHRLDKDVSGLMLIGRTQEAYEFYQDAFRERKMEKIYIALVMGAVSGDVGTINRPIARSSRRERMAARPVGQAGKAAVTHWEVLQRYANATLLRVRIETGRTHQIRAHLLSLGHPVAGDKLYKVRNMRIRPTPPRLLLHAQDLSFVDREGNAQSYHAPLPPIFQNYLASLSV
jgi:23S rRNA pseudouridine1911/1915/1917 synthase